MIIIKKTNSGLEIKYNGVTNIIGYEDLQIRREEGSNSVEFLNQETKEAYKDIMSNITLDGVTLTESTFTDLKNNMSQTVSTVDVAISETPVTNVTQNATKGN